MQDENLLNHCKTKSQQQQASSTEMYLTDNAMTFLWQTMTGIYGYRWTNSFGLSDKNNIWRACLKKVTEQQLRDGLNELIDSDFDWPPSAIEFRKLCLKSVKRALGVVSHQSAYIALTDWINATQRNTEALTPYLYEVYLIVGSYNLKNRDESTLKQEIKSACEVVNEKIKIGQSLKTPPKTEVMPQIEVKPATKETALAALNAIKQEF